MKYKVGDKVRIKSKEWWDAQPKNANGSVVCGDYNFTEEMTPLCGKTVQITVQFTNSYLILGCMYNFTDEMFDDSFSYIPEKSILSEEMIKDIAEVVNKHNLGVSISEKEGKLIIEPLKIEEDLPIDAPVMVADKLDDWRFRYYAGEKRCFIYSLKSNETDDTNNWEYIIPFDKFNPLNIEESLKYNIVK